MTHVVLPAVCLQTLSDGDLMAVGVQPTTGAGQRRRLAVNRQRLLTRCVRPVLRPACGRPLCDHARVRTPHLTHSHSNRLRRAQHGPRCAILRGAACFLLPLPGQVSGVTRQPLGKTKLSSVSSPEAVCNTRASAAHGCRQRGLVVSLSLPPSLLPFHSTGISVLRSICMLD